MSATCFSRIAFKVAIPHLLCADQVIKLELRSWDQVFKGFWQLNWFDTPQVEHALLQDLASVHRARHLHQYSKHYELQAAVI